MYLLPEQTITPNTIHHMDLFGLCNAMADASVDMILCDLPYGTTACSWDSVIPMKPMWEAFKRIIKPQGAIVLTATEPFASHLRMSNLDMYKYDWVWEKTVGTGFLNANRQPMKWYELVLMFSPNTPVYYPQFRKGEGYNVKVNSTKSKAYGNQKDVISINCGESYYPKDIIKFSNFNGNGKIHPTQKPVALFEYLIKTYTRVGQVVFDLCVGSGTTAVACRNTDRKYICGDFTREYVELARDRVRNSDPFQSTIDKKTGYKQLSLFG